jgi:hypothetical protein
MQASILLAFAPLLNCRQPLKNRLVAASVVCPPTVAMDFQIGKVLRTDHDAVAGLTAIGGAALGRHDIQPVVLEFYRSGEY